MKNTQAAAVIATLLALIAYAFWRVHEGTLDMPDQGASSITYGINGLTETRCIDGYRFVIAERGHLQQVMDEHGRAVKCN